MDRKKQQRVAIKVVRAISRYTDSAKIEVDILREVNKSDPDNTSLCVRMHNDFMFGRHICLVFESLGLSLYDYLKKHKYRPFSPKYVRAFSRQLLHAMAFMRTINLVHTDLKLENILLATDGVGLCDVVSEGHTGNWDKLEKEPSKGGGPSAVEEEQAVGSDNGGSSSSSSSRSKKAKPQYCPDPPCMKIKLIDFGGATFDDEKKSSTVNTRQYRGPEVSEGSLLLLPA
jgi:serine/threonine protein kinase